MNFFFLKQKLKQCNLVGVCSNFYTPKPNQCCNKKWTCNLMFPTWFGKNYGYVKIFYYDLLCISFFFFLKQRILHVDCRKHVIHEEKKSQRAICLQWYLHLSLCDGHLHFKPLWSECRIFILKKKNWNPTIIYDLIVFLLVLPCVWKLDLWTFLFLFIIIIYFLFFEIYVLLRLASRIGRKWCRFQCYYRVETWFIFYTH